MALAAVEPVRVSLAKAKAMIREMGYGRREGEVAALEKVLGPVTERVKEAPTQARLF